MSYVAFILESIKQDRFYLGQTLNFVNRIKGHNNGWGKSPAPFIPSGGGCLKIEKGNRSEAIILEPKLKKLTRSRLRNFIQKYAGQDESGS